MAARAAAASKKAKKFDTKPKKKTKTAKTKRKKAAPVKEPGEIKKREKKYRFIASAKKNNFLNAYAACGSVKTAALEAGVDRTTHYTWLEDETYRKAYERARQIAADALEEEARRRAVEGWMERGVRVYSDKLLIALLKANFPDRYKERVESKVELSGEVGIVEALKEARRRLQESTAEAEEDE